MAYSREMSRKQDSIMGMVNDIQAAQTDTNKELANLRNDMNTEVSTLRKELHD